jgi:hypothetical protein
MNPLIVPAHKVWSYFGTGSGPVDATYLIDWLVDAVSSRPIRGTSGSGTYGVTFAGGSKTVNIVGLINSNVSVNATVSGAISGTLTANAVPPDGVIVNPYLYNAGGGSGSSVSVAISGNPSTIVIGELMAGQAFELERPIFPGGQREFFAANAVRDDDWDLMPSMDLNAKSRRFVGETVLTSAGIVPVQEWWESQRGFSLPSFFVPQTVPNINDIWCGRLEAFSYQKEGPDIYRVQIAFKEYARTRWT